jgi:hypothetical protein
MTDRYVYAQVRRATDFRKILMVFADGRVGTLPGGNQFAGVETEWRGREDSRFLNLGWETGIEPATVGATVRCSAS